MYRLLVTRTFVAQHFLTVPNAGPENEWHSHVFTVEVQLQAPRLNEYGYLVDIDEVKATMDGLIARYRDTTMNDLPEFAGLNPSIEHFARIFCDGLRAGIQTSHLEEVTVRIWEDELARASYSHRVRAAT
ncbi:MAG: 6-carboxytetrahydropterin synthase [Rhodothermales bacterium]|nr:6-carboxytetrahydropterin synthase [Rhodothermales bacterium]